MPIKTKEITTKFMNVSRIKEKVKKQIKAI